MRIPVGERREGEVERRTPAYRHACYVPRPSHGRRWYDLILHGDPSAPEPKGLLRASDWATREAQKLPPKGEDDAHR